MLTDLDPLRLLNWLPERYCEPLMLAHDRLTLRLQATDTLRLLMLTDLLRDWHLLALTPMPCYPLNLKVAWAGPG